ncbi:MAG: aminopeptidase N [Actinobacteria bacterium]|nr:aminopeptidase N [Actinomycetota bacterium]
MSGNLTREEARRRAGLLDVDRYDVHLDLTDIPGREGEDFRSRTTITFRCREPGAATFVDLSARSVGELTLNGRRLDPAEHVRDNRIHLPELAGDNRLEVVATCQYQHSGTGLHRAVDPVDGAVYLHTQFEPYDAHLVFACFDQPDLKAKIAIAVEAPSDWHVVSNMPPTGDPADGRWAFEDTPPLSTYLAAVVAGPYHRWTDEHDGVPLGIYCRESMVEHVEVDEIWTITRQGLDFFAEAFDYPYPFGKYDQLFVPEFNFGAMENPGCVTFTENYLFRGHVTGSERESRANTILHEMAHMWFGDLVTMRWWDDLWLNESFATFMATLALEQATRFKNSWVTFEDEEKTWARYQDQLPTTHPVATDAPDLDAVHQNFDGITYAKGASVLRQLVAWVGEDAFLEGVRRYFRRFEYANAELTDLLAELEAASGRDDLESWAKEWLQTAGINTIGVRSDAPGGTYRRVTIEQQAPDDHPTLRSHRIGVGVYDLADDGLTRRTHLELDIVGESTEVEELVGEPAGDLLLPNDGDLAFCKLHLDEGSLATLEENLRALHDPLARSLCWGAAWEMVRDAAMPARRYVSMVRHNVANEPDVGVLQTILATALAAAEYYGDPDNAPPVLRVLADDARMRLDAAEPGSDRQLAWARHWISTARDDEHVANVRALLDGDLTVEGLEVDTELRWRIVKALAGLGAIDEDAIEAEHHRDPTDLGERHAAYASASRPTPDAKTAAWRRIVDEPEMSHSLMKAIMGGFSRRDQADLVRPWIEPYFDHLARMFEERPLEVALAFAHRMYPTVVVDEDVVDQTDSYLDAGEVGPSIRRVLLEERDSIVRALRTRAADTEMTT